MNTFKKDYPHEDVDMLVSMVDTIHVERMMMEERGKEEPMEITKEEFNDMVKKLEKKKKKSW